MSLTPQQLSQLVQQQSPMGHSQLQPQQQQQQLQQQSQQQPPLHQQKQQSPGIPGSTGQKSLSLTGSQQDATASGTSVQLRLGGAQAKGQKQLINFLGRERYRIWFPRFAVFHSVDSRGSWIQKLKIADDFIDSVSSFACNLAKHRKSSTLESKDILLHLGVSCKISFTLCNSGIVPGNLVGVATAATTNHGLDPLLIQAFPTFAYSTVKDFRHKKYSLQCAICLAELRDDSMLRLLKLVIMFFIKTASTFGLSLTRHARFVVETSIFRKKHWKNSGTCPQQPSE
ncbi:hypothetical protein LWI29_014709 [Acer saccharum]|uniref:Transcription initiation factor TFIID subunit 12 domain-containing protein n=1 Tax=Acer saccharum TaxID=4024 RepID=A0AA39SN47_ACESA|nr:hypothetical protein LWI29_014709 [Acer saccharum]